MTPTTRTRWMTIGLVALLAAAPQVLRAEIDRPVAGTPISVRPISYQQPALPTAASAGSLATAPVYRPPHRLAPAQGVRVGGGTRAIAGTVPALMALVPDHTGLTSQPSPTFYWYTAARVTMPVEFVLIHESTSLPVLEVQLPKPAAAGIHAIRLTDYGITLNNGELYTWSVALMPDPYRRSKDVMAFGSIIRLTTDADLPGSFDTDAVGTYASAGLWYDALDAAARSLGKMPSDLEFRARQEALLRQVGLTEVADFVELASIDTLSIAH